MTNDQKKIVAKILDDMFIAINATEGSNTAQMKIEMYALIFAVAYTNGFTPEEMFINMKHVNVTTALETTKRLMKAMDDENKRIERDCELYKEDMSIRVNDKSKKIH